MISEKKITELLKQKIEDTDIFLIEIKISNNNKIKVLVDKKEGITIKECVEISRFIESNLDREIEDFDLEVSSPGLTEPLKIDKQYEKYIGKKVEVVTNDNQSKIGKLLHKDKEKITIEYEITKKEKKKKIREIVTADINFEEIKFTKVIISFK